MLELKSERLVCRVEPLLGGCIAGLWLDEVAVLRPPPAEGLMAARQAGSYPLVPYSNRIGDATLHWQGTVHPLVRNNGAEPHAIHGVGWQRPWTVQQAEADFAVLAFQHRPDPAWPFAFDSTQTFSLRGQSLEMTLSMTNQSAQPTPAGLGWHPYFVKRPGACISFKASARWEMGSDKLPTQRAHSEGMEAECADLDVDHCFDGWSGTVRLHDEVLLTQIRSNVQRLVVFTNKSRDFVAIEPVSHVNNAMNLVAQGEDPDKLGLRILQPGESMTIQMSIQPERAP